MNASLRRWRALLLVLLLPALLAPSGWSLRVCFCMAVQGQAEDVAACCRVEIEAPSCCDSLEQTAEGGDDCAACHSFEAAHHGLQPVAGNAAGELAPAMLELASWTAADSTSPSATTAAASVRRGQAPPGLATPLPLRI